MRRVIIDAEALDDFLKIDPPPAHHAVDDRIGTGFDNLGELGQLLGRKPRRRAAVGLGQAAGSLALLTETITSTVYAYETTLTCPAARAAAVALSPLAASCIPAPSCQG